MGLLDQRVNAFAFWGGQFPFSSAPPPAMHEAEAGFQGVRTQWGPWWAGAALLECTFWCRQPGNKYKGNWEL